jgi:hypothetical protein
VIGAREGASGMIEIANIISAAFLLLILNLAAVVGSAWIANLLFAL